MSRDERFNMPKGMYRVTAGSGGESFLIDAGRVVSLYDCGMAYCAPGLIKNIKDKLEEIGKEKPDMVLLSHSHYDHIGALPYIIKEWPNIKVYGLEKLSKVFSSDQAKETIKRLGESAREKYTKEGEEKIEIITHGLRVDRILADGEEFDMGDYTVKAIKTPGHTDCSVSYLLKEKEGEHKTIFFLSESVGVLESENFLHTSILKSFDDTILSAKKCKDVNADILISSHYGVVPEETKDRYFDLYIEFAEKERDFILDLYDKGLSFDEIYQGYEDVYWVNSRIGAQPREAFKENAGYTIRCLVKDFRGKDI